ncbi:hypothetical protein PAP_08330 [Palaeococcus pacificus DY20341]|uniref:DUF996 domain-containing protein n=1 Tax=Palaeococcus pacificus DY20341 TaxID=1343739 RepID=A0A075LUJ8_9EURY|nr:DUF996 domain-containing protein [Palaeococcus pacificus]AIF70054.1 hypothetical protein PAP_08330 [Palaeococcus pacificus DY20341]
MPYVREARERGKWGAMLMLIGILTPTIGGLLQFIGFILLLLTVRDISHVANDIRPYKNFIYSTIIGIGGIASFIALLKLRDDFSTGETLIFLLFLWGLFVATVYFEKETWIGIYKITRTGEFYDAAKWLWYGVLTLPILIGGILALIGRIHLIFAFSRMPIKIESEEEG